ncbi:MAG TPA: GNAT family N-acetyltransferase [Pseudolabrys sp.]|nr:GNAT family N-acetyltransferase [Pseudolabrys sp.]
MAAHDITIDVYDDLGAVEDVWRAFERLADGTAFQTFEWLSTWQQHIGAREGVRPAVVIGRDDDGAVLFLLPLAMTRRRYGRVLSFLGSELCDYNAPLLAPDFARRLADPMPLLQRVLNTLRARCGYDVVFFEKMPETVGAQANPFLKLSVMLHPSGSYQTRLGDDWDAFYREKRSTSTRQRDRGKRKKLGKFGAIGIVHPDTDADILATLDVLMAQKGKAFERMGVADMFAKPGYRDFYRAMATGPATRALTHVSRLQVGDEMAAVNLGLTFRDRYYYVLASYGDGEMSRFGPGAAHLRDLMEYAIGRGFGVFDFTVGDEPYKREWCGESPLYDHIAGANARGAVVAAGLREARALKRRIKRNPRLWQIALRAREVLGRLRRPQPA